MNKVHNKALSFSKSILTFSILFVLSLSVYSQQDTVYLKGNDMLTGELKEMKQNIVTFNTSYSNEDFKIKWGEILFIQTSTKYSIALSSSERLSGRLQSRNRDTLEVYNHESLQKVIPISEIVFLRKVDASFWNNLDASLSLGFTFAKANNLSQYNVRSNLGYRTTGWSASTSYNHIVSTQNQVLTTQRLDANLIYKHYFPEKWFGLAEVNWLSNTAQNINLRTLSKLGLGRYLVRNNQLYWGVQSGISYNIESFNVTGELTNNTSAEAFLGTEANLYNIGDFSLLSRIVAYPSLSESKRWRTDFTFDMKYNLPLDFFINLGLSLNYDNQPVQTTNQTDYVFQTTFGWSL